MHHCTASRMSRNAIQRYLETDDLPRYLLAGSRPSAIIAYVSQPEVHVDIE
jgi:hypothetical protein